MNKTIVNKIIVELNEELKSQYPDFKGIYLFGSYARGTAVEDSDIDLALVFDREIDWKFKDRARDKIIDKEIAHCLIIDSHFFNINDLIEPTTPLKENIKFEGVFYDA